VPTLKEAVATGLEAQGLQVEDDRGGLLVTDASGGSYSLRVDETERVVCAETTLCYPVDDFSPELSMAIDYLNRQRAGVSYYFRESRRAVMVSSAWTSPGRDPADNQLHLLIAMLDNACRRDAPNLERVSEGDAGWFEVADGEELPRQATSSLSMSGTPGAGSGQGRIDAASSAMFDRSRMATQSFDPIPGASGPQGDAEEDWDFPIEEAFSAGSRARESAKAGATPGGHDDTGRFHDLPTQNTFEGPDRYSKKGEGEDPSEPSPPRKTSRMALQMAVQQSEKSVQPPKIAYQGPSLAFRLFKFVFWLALVGGGGGAAFMFLVYPLIPANWRSYVDFSSGGEEVAPPDPVAERAAMAPGKALLRAEMENPLSDEKASARNVNRSIKALGLEQTQATLEELMLATPDPDVRRRAYEVWDGQDFGEPDGARLRLLEQLHTAQLAQGKVTDFLLYELRNHPPTFQALEEALGWAKPKTPIWLGLIEMISVADATPEARAALLLPQLEDETSDLLVLRCLLLTGEAPRGSIARLVAERFEWVETEGGEEFVVGLLETQPDLARDLLTSDNKNVVLAGLRLLAETGTPEALRYLEAILLDQDQGEDVRFLAAQGISKVSHASSVWSLSRALRSGELNADLRAEVARALQSLPNPEAADELRERLDDSIGARGVAVYGLEQMSKPAAVRVLIEVALDQAPVPALPSGDRERRAQARYLNDIQLYSLNVLQEQHQLAGNTLSSRVVEFLNLSRDNGEPQNVRQAAERLYRTIRSN
jgi:Putative bacterial sensory transduction regulator